MAGKIDCLNTLGSKCWADEELEKVKLNIKLKEVEKAVNNSVLLGNDLIDSCAYLKNIESEVVKEITGSDKCRFTEWREKKM